MLVERAVDFLVGLVDSFAVVDFLRVVFLAVVVFFVLATEVPFRLHARQPIRCRLVRPRGLVLLSRYFSPGCFPKAASTCVVKRIGQATEGN